jgi:hypothetical protein
MGPTYQYIIEHEQIGDPFGVASELMQDFSLIGEAPLHDNAIFEAAEHCLFGKAGRHDLISNL